MINNNLLHENPENQDNELIQDPETMFEQNLDNIQNIEYENVEEVDDQSVISEESL